MIDKSKLTLSEEEQLLMGNAEWILTKRKITDTVNFLFGNLAGVMKEQILNEENLFPLAVVQSTPKIAKGENYRQLPYVILDYPRCFDKENVFAIRTMFWWGNFFSCSLHLSGKYKILFENVVQKNIYLLQKNNFYICINKDEWQHHFEADNYLPVNILTENRIKTIIVQQHFIKVAVRFSLQQWNEMPVLLEKSFEDILYLLK